MPLDSAKEKAALLDAFHDEASRTVLDGPLATREGVYEALFGHRWVHFSCHGDQDLRDPSRGGLLLSGNTTLTIAEVIDGHFQGDFAGLSACKTAMGGVHLLDEAVTLAAALQYTGYRHVVASLWSVDNAASSRIFAALYQAIASDGRLRSDLAAAALHDAVRELRRDFPNWPHRWTPFIHAGP